jgi:hypothetical protein
MVGEIFQEQTISLIQPDQPIMLMKVSDNIILLATDGPEHFI